MIDINLNNYEEYFIDYFDGSLSSSEQEILMSFIEQYPHLKEEFYFFGKEELVKDTVSFKNKTSLYKKPLLKNTDDSNFDELCIAYFCYGPKSL